MIAAKDFLAHVSDDGEWTPSFIHTLAEKGNKKLTADVYIKDGVYDSVVLFCIYIDGEGDSAFNVLEDAVKEFNS